MKKGTNILLSALLIFTLVFTSSSVVLRKAVKAEEPKPFIITSRFQLNWTRDRITISNSGL